MPEIYVVTEGSYSDYHIEAVFSTRQLADRYADIAGGSVEVYGLDEPKGMDRYDNGERIYYVNMDWAGTCKEEPSLSEHELRAWVRTSANYGLWGNIWAGSAEHAVKIMNEKRMGMLAAKVATGASLTSVEEDGEKSE